MLNLMVMFREVPLTILTKKLMSMRHVHISRLLAMQGEKEAAVLLLKFFD